MTSQTSDAPTYPCPRHPRKPVAPGLRVCAACNQHAAGDLRYLSAHWANLHELHYATRNGQAIRAIHATPPAPCRTDVLDLERDLTAILHAWTRLVVEDRNLTDPPTSAPAQATWLLVHLEWLCASDFAEEAVDEIHTMRRDLAGIIGDRPSGQRVLCPLDDCGAPLRVDLANPEQVIVCRGCGCTWTAARLLLHAVAGEAEAWADAEAIGSVTGLSRATLDRWARHGRIQRRHGMFQISQVLAARDNDRRMA